MNSVNSTNKLKDGMKNVCGYCKLAVGRIESALQCDSCHVVFHLNCNTGEFKCLFKSVAELGIGGRVFRMLKKKRGFKFH